MKNSFLSYIFLHFLLNQTRFSLYFPPFSHEITKILSKVRKKMGRVWGGPSLLLDLNLLATKIISQRLLRVENGCIGEQPLGHQVYSSARFKVKVKGFTKGGNIGDEVDNELTEKYVGVHSHRLIHNSFDLKSRKKIHRLIQTYRSRAKDEENELQIEI